MKYPQTQYACSIPHTLISTYRQDIILPSVHALGYRLCGLNVTVLPTSLGGDGAGWVHGHGLPLLLRAPSSCSIIIMSAQCVRVCPEQHIAQCTSPSPGACCCCFTSAGAWIVTSHKQHGERAGQGIGAMPMNGMVARRVKTVCSRSLYAPSQHRTKRDVLSHLLEQTTA